ncbi:hypothetical protein O181_059054 [Austropuccinia psidii MF-1]|uniref:Calcineurin-like phosphoesterase domain-containing protein n=1 Tax=Austropuccinia psidii MF-1 TaxID=1389203 RepID=A0A9Q3HY92_9BASI|nr:hypothetical protein [Austropuccinia psidii MF-1]
MLHRPGHAPPNLIPPSMSSSLDRHRLLDSSADITTYGTSNSHPSADECPSLPFYQLHFKKFQRLHRSFWISLSILSCALGVYLYNIYAHQDLVDQLAQSIEKLSTCGSCQALLVPLVSIAHLGDAKLYKTLVGFCTGLGIQDDQVCQGALAAQAPVLAHSLRSMKPGSHTAVMFCAKTFGLCQDPPVRDWPDMPLPLSPPNLNISSFSSVKLSSRSSKSKKPPLQFIHLSDLHIDREYTIGAEALCSRNLCCRVNQPSDTPNKTMMPAGPYGNHNCDSPQSLYISMLKALTEHAPNAAFAIHTGDMVDHAVWNSVRKEVEDGIEQGHAQFSTYSNIPLYGVIGNHDVAPTNSFPRNTTITTLSSQWDIELFSNTWSRWIGQGGAQKVEMISGCYSRIHPGTNLKIISLNTGFWYKANFWLYDSNDFQPDPNGILTWLIQELHDAETLGQKAWIIGHLSPGKADCLHEPSRYINQILRRYKNTIAACFFGHTHRSEWEIIYEDPLHPTAETAIGTIYIGPAMTPESGNPAFRVYDIDPDSYEVMDFHEIITDLSSPNFQSHPEWFKYYSARETYGKMVAENTQSKFIEDDQPLDGSFWHLVTDVLEASYPEFEKFYGRLTRGAHLPNQNWKPCYSGECRRKWVQNLRSSQSEYNQYPNKIGLHLDSVDTSGDVKNINQGFKLNHDEEDGEHVCGDLASLYKHAKRKFGHTMPTKIKIPNTLKQEIRSQLAT